MRGEFAEKVWQAFYSVTVENRTAAEVATALGISRNEVYLAKSRVLKRLREEFGQPSFNDGGGDRVREQ